VLDGVRVTLVAAEMNRSSSPVSTLLHSEVGVRAFAQALNLSNPESQGRGALCLYASGFKNACQAIVEPGVLSQAELMGCEYDGHVGAF